MVLKPWFEKTISMNEPLHVQCNISQLGHINDSQNRILRNLFSKHEAPGTPKYLDEIS